MEAAWPATLTVSCPELEVATTASDEVGTAPSTQVPVEFQFPPPLAMVRVAAEAEVARNREPTTKTRESKRVFEKSFIIK